MTTAQRDKVETDREQGLDHDLIRLRKGQKWLVARWREWWDVYPWPQEFLDRWQQSYDAWDELERSTRERWNLRTCVIGSEGCHVDAPINCGACSGRVNRSADRQPTLFPNSRPHS